MLKRIGTILAEKSPYRFKIFNAGKYKETRTVFFRKAKRRK